TISVPILEVAFEMRNRTGAALPVWWDFEDVASCRRGQLFPDPDLPEETPTCAAWSPSVGMPRFVIDRSDFQFPTADVARMVVSSRGGGGVPAGRRSLACRLLLTPLGSTGGCAGCREPVRITVTAINVGGVLLTQPITQNTALWQPDGPVATRATSWGALK